MTYQRAVQRDDVRRLQQLVERHVLEPQLFGELRLAVRVVSDHARAEALEDANGRQADVPRAHHSNGLRRDAP